MAVFSSEDATVDVNGLHNCLLENCKELGAQIFENCAVRRILINENRKIYAVDTDEG